MPRTISLSTATRIADFLWPEFEERDGVVLLAGMPTPQLSDFDSRTEAESFYNHEHILDHFRHAIPGAENPEDSFWEWDMEHPDFERACELGRRVAKMWAAKLHVDFPHYQFRVYWTKLDEPIVRFHRVRKNERAWRDDSDASKLVRRGEALVVTTGAESTLA